MIISLFSVSLSKQSIDGINNRYTDRSKATHRTSVTDEATGPWLPLEHDRIRAKWTSCLRRLWVYNAVIRAWCSPGDFVALGKRGSLVLVNVEWPKNCKYRKPHPVGKQRVLNHLDILNFEQTVIWLYHMDRPFWPLETNGSSDFTASLASQVSKNGASSCPILLVNNWDLILFFAENLSTT